MACVRGCCSSQAEHYRSLRVSSPERRELTKVTTERDSSVEVDVTEHWHDRQDVLVKPKTFTLKTKAT